jgi:hypothetical protein
LTRERESIANELTVARKLEARSREMLRRWLSALLIACAVGLCIAAPAAWARVECGPMICVPGDCGYYNCTCVFFSQTGEYQGYIEYHC